MRKRPELGLDGEPELVFQPAVDLATGRLLGFEAFLRWNDPDLGPIPPSVLIPWAEANGHMVELNAWVLSEACAAAASWQADLQLAVNCSVFQLRQREAASAAAAAIEESGLNPDRLTIEITETSVTDDGGRRRPPRHVPPGHPADGGRHRVGLVDHRQPAAVRHQHHEDRRVAHRGPGRHRRREPGHGGDDRAREPLARHLHRGRERGDRGSR